MESADKIAILEKYLQAFADSDIEVIRKIYADNAVLEDPVGSEPHVGLDAVVDFYVSAMSNGTSLELTGSPRCAGNAMAFPFAAQVGDVRPEIIDVFEFDAEGKIISMKAYWSY